MLFGSMVKLFLDYNLFENNNYTYVIIMYLINIYAYPYGYFAQTENDYSHLYAIKIKDYIW